MYMIAEVSQYVAVASFAEAWIEIISAATSRGRISRSPPSRRRGLKLLRDIWRRILNVVASFAEAWIEMLILRSGPSVKRVASFAEAWIEMSSMAPCLAEA